MKSMSIVCFVVALMMSLFLGLQAQEEEFPGFFDNKELNVDTFYLPAIWIQPDKDGGEPNDGLNFGARVGRGDGHGVRVSLNKKGVSGSLGILYLEGRHRDGRVGAQVTSLVVALDGEFHTTTKYRHFDMRYYFAMGAGGGGVYFSRYWKDSTGALAEIRTGMGMIFNDHLAFNIGGGAFFWGSPGETKGAGEFLSANLSLKF